MQFDRNFPTHPTYHHLDRAVREATDRIQKHGDLKVDRVVGMARGGLFPAMIMSHILNVPMTAIHYSSKKGEGEYKMYDNDRAFDSLMSDRKERLLVVDDICDSGHTFREVVECFDVLKVHPVITYAIYYKEREEGSFKPNLHTYTIPEDAPWIIFPWEGR